jgi:hypothetical protein
MGRPLGETYRTNCSHLVTTSPETVWVKAFKHGQPLSTVFFPPSEAISRNPRLESMQILFCPRAAYSSWNFHPRVRWKISSRCNFMNEDFKSCDWLSTTMTQFPLGTNEFSCVAFKFPCHDTSRWWFVWRINDTTETRNSVSAWVSRISHSINSSSMKVLRITRSFANCFNWNHFLLSFAA